MKLTDVYLVESFKEIYRAENIEHHALQMKYNSQAEATQCSIL